MDTYREKKKKKKRRSEGVGEGDEWF